MKIPIKVVDWATREPVEAELFDDAMFEHFLETQKEWRPVVLEAVQQMNRMGARPDIIPRHFHWDWTSKAADLGMLAFSFLGVSVGGELQGLMKLESVGSYGRIGSQTGKPVMYVDYLETAPWNIKPLMQALGNSPKFGAVGTRLIEAAVRTSIDEGYKGRLALHSLPSSEQFYLQSRGMTGVGRDPGKQNLLWCEFTLERAEEFLREVDTWR